MVGGDSSRPEIWLSLVRLTVEFGAFAVEFTITEVSTELSEGFILWIDRREAEIKVVDCMRLGDGPMIEELVGFRIVTIDCLIE